ncbi:MAG: dTDP-4-dehydrorhamnose 3,5-epimerase [Bacteroidetes bacterium]|nr:dTDP-4-dehydrorhamnose 3,5-epimerase [Bacteroidota bacterium]
MKLLETGFSGLVIIEPEVFSDDRGYFMESFNSMIFSRQGIRFTPVQDNESSSVKGVIRGLHYQINPFAQAKLIRVIAGTVFDVVADLRRDSATFGKWYGIELDGNSKRQLFIPRGFAHGFSVLSESAVIQYKCDNHYNPQAERGISLSDPYLAIDWKTDTATAIISGKDRLAPLFADAEMNF